MIIQFCHKYVTFCVTIFMITAQNQHPNNMEKEDKLGDMINILSIKYLWRKSEYSLISNPEISILCRNFKFHSYVFSVHWLKIEWYSGNLNKFVGERVSKKRMKTKLKTLKTNLMLSVKILNGRKIKGCMSVINDEFASWKDAVIGKKNHFMMILLHYVEKWPKYCPVTKIQK